MSPSTCKCERLSSALYMDDTLQYCLCVCFTLKLYDLLHASIVLVAVSQKNTHTVKIE